MTEEPVSRRVEEIAQPVHITLTKNTKGYQWEISIFADSVHNTLAQIDAADQELKAKYSASETTT